MRPFPKLQKNLISRAEKLRREYLWIIIGILLFGHLIWIGWVVYTEFFLIPKATITRDQQEQFQREVEAQNKFVSSYSFYDSWGDLSSRLAVNELGIELTAKQAKGIGTDLRIYVKKDNKNILLEKIFTGNLEEVDKISWNDIFVSLGGQKFSLLNYQYSNTVIDIYDKNLEKEKTITIAARNDSVKALLDYQDSVCFIWISSEPSMSKTFARNIKCVDLNTTRANIIYKEETTVESDKYVSDVRLTGPYFDKIILYEKIFHFGNTYNYSKTAVDVEKGTSDLFESYTIKGIY